jgi:drug/metabolite transporter, DME family
MDVTAITHGRLCILAAAVLWSLSGAFTKALTTDTFLGVNVPAIAPLAGTDIPIQIAFYRAFFAGLVLVPTLRRRDLQFKPMMLVMLLCFALMNATFISAQALGSAANAILLQNSAPLWMYLASVFWLGEPATWRSSISLFIGMLGIGIIIAGGWTEGKLEVIAIGLLSGFTYAGVILGLRILRDVAPSWLTVWNHLLGSLLLLPFVIGLEPPSWQQFGVLFLFGAIQLGLPYWLMARGLRSVSAPEAGAITLLEPILTPFWPWLIADETPGLWTFVGGAVILLALAYRYFPAFTLKPNGKQREPLG